MNTSCVSLVLVILSAISSVNYGFPHSTLPSSTVADVIEVSTNQDASVGLVRTSATPSEERHTMNTTPLPNPSTSDHGDDDDDDATSVSGLLDSDVNDHAPTHDVNGADEVGRAVADLSQGAVNQGDTHNNDNTSTAQNGFPWWSLMLILLATVVIIIAIAFPFVLYNRRLNKRQAVIKNNKRASELIVDSWVAASQSSIPPVSPSTSSDSGHEDDVETTCKQGKTTPQSDWGTFTMEDGNSHDIILGAEGGC
ncbi:uncharacterized protein LOC100888513 [Strongylocentrotus purpuratus]|uniref:Uncharacterized protein n=1 Tax=Strongylocentrotus purpuratus TaxID=7668 RepID=A0A7M7GIA1_STRPU|nr:uncharacterized protein LOC100888513 [Strongylocentrotus purpuratus]|eukprot:XP_003729181.1 PREDICTED: uncharacterized protein LOC100888513 [Strongylocentrotus purpuratus]